MYAKLHKWEEVYRRDGYRCQNPVCVRCDVTLHHLLYRAMGGGDELWNVLALCWPCHLEGEHEGRLKVIGPADEPTWMLGRRGRAPLIVVKGRRRIRA
jgi:5-methylcytosine-specific restriction endonuclease McrA